MKYRNVTRERIGIACLSFLLAVILTGMIVDHEQEAQRVQAQQELAQEVLRFHILANSDSSEDQTLKLKVRDRVLEWLQTEMPDYLNVTDTKLWIKEHQNSIEMICEEEIHRYGYDYPVSVAVTTCYFPEKCYGNSVFPAGNYEALRIEIGAAKGHNWWCVLYPNLCFIDAVRVVMPEEGMLELKKVLSEDAYDICMKNTNIKWKSYFLERCKK